MIFKLIRLKIQKEIEELKSLHRIEIAEKEAKLKRREDELKSEHEIRTREVVSLLKLESQQKIAAIELDSKRALDVVKNDAAAQISREKEGLLQEYYDKLSTAMSKLHEDGNITTRFTQDLALKMFENMPTQKTQTKVLTGNVDKCDK